MHAESQEEEPHERSLEPLKERIKFLSSQEKEIKEDIDQVINRDAELKKEVEIISSIPGVGELTAAIILGETNGFELIRNKKQLTSYAGFDVKEKQSGQHKRHEHAILAGSGPPSKTKVEKLKFLIGN